MKRLLKIFVILILLLYINGNAQTPINILQNGGFEQGFSNWSASAILESNIKYSGNYSAKFLNNTGMIDQIVSVDPNTDYKATFWIYLDQSFTGNDWGGASLGITDYNWNLLASSIFINPTNRSKGKWHAFSVQFNTGSVNSVRLSVGFFGGSGWNAVFYVDEVKLFKKNAVNVKPVISLFQVNPLSGNTPLTVNMSLSAYDVDGVVEGYYFQTSDGGYYEGEQANHTFNSPGTYSITAIVKDDDNELTTDVKLVTVSGTQQTDIQITSPFTGDFFETSSEELNIAGHFTGSVQNLFWFNEKNHQNGYASINGSNFSFNLPLRYGKNYVILQARLSNNTYFQKQVLIFRKPQNYSGPELVDYNFSSQTVETFQKLEIQFNLNTIADNYWFPYEENLPPNLNTGKGVTVDCIFTKGNKTVVFPAFYDMPYQRFNNYLLPSGYFIWKVRASFDEPGQYNVTLKAIDSLGQKTYSLGSINVTQSENNKGVLRVSEFNNRYFEYSDGSSFFGLGFNDGPDIPIKTDQKVAAYSENGVNTFRVWLSSISQFSDPWCAWTTHHQMENNGYMNTPLYRFNRKYKNGDFSIRIASPPIPNVNTPAVFRGFYDGGNNIKPNTNYRITMRVKLENVVSSNGGFSIKLSGWAGEDIVNLNVGNRIFGPLTGSTDWILCVGEYTSASNEIELPYLYAVLEGNTTGEVYIDMVLLQEKYSNGRLSENIISKWSANPHYYFDPIKPRYFDYFVEKATNKKIHLKTVIFEKDDYILNRIDPSGFPSNQNGSFDAPPGTKLRRLYEYYWRNLIARWGYSDAIHSWELVNEGAPGSFKNLVNDFSDYFDLHSPHKHMTTTSFWAMWVPEYWQSSHSDYGDVHAYVHATGFIDTATFLGELYNRQRMQHDPAALINIYSKHIGGDPLRNKPVIIGEMDLDTPGGQNPDPALASDTEGIWLKGFLWGHLNVGAVTGLIWDPVNIRNNNLYQLYKPVSKFFSKIQFNKFKFKEPVFQISNPNVQGWGIIDEIGQQIYFYSRHKDYFWRKVLDQGLPQAQNSNFSFYKVKPGDYIIKFYSTITGNETNSFSAQVGNDSTISINNVNIDKDIAISIVNNNIQNTDDDENYLPENFTLFQNYPNPFNAQTKIAFEIPKDGDVEINIYGILGNLIENVTLKNLSKGRNVYNFSANNLSSGIYFVNAVFEGKNITVKMVLLK